MNHARSDRNQDGSTRPNYEGSNHLSIYDLCYYEMDKCVYEVVANGTFNIDDKCKACEVVWSKISRSTASGFMSSHVAREFPPWLIQQSRNSRARVYFATSQGRARSGHCRRRTPTPDNAGRINLTSSCDLAGRLTWYSYTIKRLRLSSSITVISLACYRHVRLRVVSVKYDAAQCSEHPGAGAPPRPVHVANCFSKCVPGLPALGQLKRDCPWAFLVNGSCYSAVASGQLYLIRGSRHGGS
jgi:hypothetical protein